MLRPHDAINQANVNHVSSENSVQTNLSLKIYSWTLFMLSRAAMAGRVGGFRIFF